MFCIVSLRCSSEGPSLRRDPAKAVGRLPQLPPLRQLAPKARSGAGSRARAATRSGAAGVAGGNRTDLGDQSVGGIGAFESQSGTRSRTGIPAGSSSVLALGTRIHATGHPDLTHFPVMFTPRWKAVWPVTRRAIGSGARNRHRITCINGTRSGPAVLRQGFEGDCGCVHEMKWKDAAGHRLHGVSGIHADDRLPEPGKAGRERRQRDRDDMISYSEQEARSPVVQPSGFHETAGSRTPAQRENTDSPSAFRLMMAETPMTRPPTPPRRLSARVESMAFFVTP